MKIGFIGLGAMGGALCQNIVRKHDDHVYAYDIRPEALKDVCLTGAMPCRSAAETAKKSGSDLYDGPDIRSGAVHL